MPPILKSSLRYAVLLLILWFLLRHLDEARLLHLLMSIHVGWMALMLVLGVTVFCVMGLRLHHLAPREIRLKDGILASLLASGLNMFFPGKLGEFAKVFYLRQHTGLSLPRGMGILIWERFYDLNALLILGWLAAFQLGRMETALPFGAVILLLWLGILCMELFPALDAWIEIRLLPARLRPLFREFVTQLRQFVAIRSVLTLGSITGLLWLLLVTGGLLAPGKVLGLNLDPGQAFMVFTAFSLGSLIPLTPGSLGTTEAAVVLICSWYGVGKEEALAVALLLRVYLALPSLLGTMVLLSSSDLNLRTLRQANRPPG